MKKQKRPRMTTETPQARAPADRFRRRHNLELEKLVRQRTDELEVAQRRLRISDNARTHWIEMLGHELRTPLAGIFCITSTLFHEVPPERDLSGLRADYDVTCQRIRKLLNDAMTLATLNVAPDTVSTETVRIGDALHMALAAAQQTATDVTFTLKTDVSTPASTSAPSDLLCRALTELLTTAACCTRSGGHVEVSVTPAGRQSIIALATQGKMLPADDLDTFFELGGQRTLLKGGADFGLGPALAHGIIRRIAGAVGVRNGSAEGIVIEVRLPVA